MKSHTVGIQTHPEVHEVESRRPPLSERVADFLRQRHPLKTAIHVAAETGLPANTVKTWLQRGSAPDADGYTALWLAYGPDFLAVLAGEREPSWLADVRRAQESSQLKAEIAALELKLAGVRR